ncbi:uncharacterized protein BYT42DRAFT_617286 [Radiomyces spectabilis]|uniref:uncharacterized protein n=1 Tax=Radiomyces spectabilis TaxID=64574 RepID=UPI00221FF0A5|nr:uncharacterized protein BYT42DRAFT_617286 [Radiomyces spectabilis]KAI8369245.1 hypothetical protein BYT42DRAFT_617286 [Radiomyces spectabilis]
MSEYTYSMTKDPSKFVPLYHHEQVPFHSFSRPPSTHAKSQPEFQPTTPVLSSPLQQQALQQTTTTTTTQQPQPQQQQQTQDPWAKNSMTNPASCDLQDVILYYQNQPDLLRLILLSKLEEDKRRAEEAKLRAKELDLLLLQQQQLPHTPSIPADMSFNTSNSMISTSQTQFANFGMQPTPPPSTTSSIDQRIMTQSQPLHLRRTSLDAILASPQCAPTMQRRDSALGSSLGGSANTDELDDRTFSPIPTSNTAGTLLQMGSYTPPNLMSLKQPHPLSPSYMDEVPFSGTSMHLQSETPRCTSVEQPSAQLRHEHHYSQRPRRRREMQAITKIVETRENPYMDGYFWKNNGNTIQKKTGNKSVYYKCSNSTKGCPVNKTVTWKDNGEFLIKYRGEHLPDCGKVQRIVDM